MICRYYRLYTYQQHDKLNLKCYFEFLNVLSCCCRDFGSLSKEDVYENNQLVSSF